MIQSQKLAMLGAGMLALAGFSACVGNLAEPDGSGSSAGPGAGAGAGSGNGPGAGGSASGGSSSTKNVDCSTAQAGVAPLRRLTARQYANSVRDVFDGKVTASPQFPTQDTGISVSGFSTDPEMTAVSQRGAESIMLAAEDTAVAVGERLAEFLDCYPAQQNEACASRFIDRYGPRAFRRPLLADERSALLERFRAVTGQGFDVAIAAVVQTLLEAPQFLYLAEIGSVDRPSGAFELTGYEVASRLSYLLWESGPDDALMGAAADGTLATAAGVRAEAERLLDDPRAEQALTRFYREWTRMKPVAKDATTFPDYTASLANSMQEQFDRFVVDATLGPDATLPRLLTRKDTFANADLASFYGITLPAGTEPFQPVTLPSDRASGILTQPALLGALAHDKTTSIVFRGKFVRSKLLCTDLPDPPADAAQRLPAFPPNATTRQKSEILRAVPECGQCHNLMDSIGIGFEAFDAIGRFSPTGTDGAPVDDNGSITKGRDSSVEGDFDGVPALGEMLASSPDVQRCMTRQWFRFTFSRKDAAADVCGIDQALDRFTKSGLSMRELILAVTELEAFRRRLPEGGQP